MGPEDQHSWDREDEEIRVAFAKKDAEIERLKLVLADYEDADKWKNNKLMEQHKLITALCDALVHYAWANHEDMKLIQRAREVTR